MKVAQIVTEAPRIEPGFDISKAMSGIIDVDKKEPTISSKKSTNTALGPLKGQAIKHRGVVYQWKGANWIVTDNSEWKQKNPRNKKSFRVGSIAPADTTTVLNNKAIKKNAGPGGKTDTKQKMKNVTPLKTTDVDKTDYQKDMDKANKKTDMPVLLADSAKIKWDTLPGEISYNDGQWYSEILSDLQDNPGCVGFHLCGGYQRNRSRRYGLIDEQEIPDKKNLPKIIKANENNIKWVEDNSK